MSSNLDIYTNAYLEADTFGSIGMYGVSGPVEVFEVGYLLHRNVDGMRNTNLVALKYYAVIAALQLAEDFPFNVVTIHTDYGHIIETIYRGFVEKMSGPWRSDPSFMRNELLRSFRLTKKDIRVHFTDNDMIKKAKDLAINCVDTGEDISVNVPMAFRDDLNDDFNDDSPLMA